MKYTTDDIRKFALDEVAGSITPDDKEVLYSSIASDEEALAIWKDVHGCFSNHAVQDAIERLPETLPLESVMAKVRTGSRNKIYGIAAIGVAAALIGLVLFYWIDPTTKDLSTNQYAQQSVNNEIELKLPNGSRVNLSLQQGQVQVAGLTLSNTQKSLTYTLTSNTNGAEAASLHIPPSKDYKITLSDGTEVWLNSVTSLVFPLRFGGNTREVQVNGEAYFKVSPDAHKPFLVHLPHGTVEVLGTEFNVNTYDSGQVNVSLVEGSVAMKVEKDSLTLKPGFEIAYKQHQGMQVRSFDPEILSWRQGIYTFQDAKLEEVLKIVPRWYGADVVFDNHEHDSKRFFGVVNRKHPVQELLERLKAINKIEYHIDKNGVIHIR